MSSRWLLLFALPVLLRLLKTRRGPSREKIILPREERVVLLGASSGVGKDLALAYAKRGGKMCVMAHLLDDRFCKRMVGADVQMHLCKEKV